MNTFHNNFISFLSEQNTGIAYMKQNTGIAYMKQNKIKKEINILSVLLVDIKKSNNLINHGNTLL